MSAPLRALPNPWMIASDRLNYTDEERQAAIDSIRAGQVERETRQRLYERPVVVADHPDDSAEVMARMRREEEARDMADDLINQRAIAAADERNNQ